ncbi:MAG: hypothetical protein V4629_05420 [Pseudomonadota bacterium]
MGDTSIDHTSSLTNPSNIFLKNDLSFTSTNDADDFSSLMKSFKDQEEAVSESSALNLIPLAQLNNRSEATGYGASSIEAIQNKDSWFHAHNMHGNTSAETWLNRVKQGMFDNGAGSITQAYQKGYFSDPQVQSVAKSLIGEGAIVQTQWDDALARSANGNPSAEDKYIFGTVALRHAASFGDDKNSLNWEQDVLKEKTYLSYLENKGISLEFAHGTLNNFKSGLSAVQTGGDALTVESNEWKLNNYKNWAASWGNYINENAASASNDPTESFKKNDSNNKGTNDNSGGLIPNLLKSSENGFVLSKSGTGALTHEDKPVNFEAKNLTANKAEGHNPSTTPGTINYQGGGDFQNLQSFRKRDGSNGYASYFNPGNVSNHADGGLNLQIKGTSSAEIISPVQLTTGTSVTSTVVFSGTPRVVESIFAYGNQQGKLNNSKDITEFDIVETGLHPSDPNKFYSGWWGDKYSKTEHFGWDRRDFGIEFGKPTTFVTNFKEDSFTVYVKQSNGDLKELKTFYPTTMDRMNSTFSQMMYNNWLQDDASKNLSINYQVLAETRAKI